MSRPKKYRMLMTTFTGLFLLAGGGTAGAAMAAKFEAILTGGNVIPAGDADGWGRAKINIDDSANRLCADLEVRSIGKVTAVNIYKGAAGAAGAPVVKLDAPDDDDSEDCDAIGDALADEIQANPANFYVAVQTAENPNGAIRGQLVPSAN